MKTPIVDLNVQYLKYKAEIDAAVHAVLDTSHYILGANVRALEAEFAEYLGVDHAISVASGTDALHLALLAAGIKQGDEVITTPFTFIGTAEAISYVGAIPVFVDIDLDTLNMDPAKIEAAISDKTTAILPVHLFGLPAAMDPIVSICKTHNLKLIEDCAQSFGAHYKGKMTGSFGAFGCFSFYPSKNLGAYGDGGLITTNDADLAEKIKILRNHGSDKPYHHSIIGYNSRLDEIQAAILRVKFTYIEEFNRLRRAHAAMYRNRMESLDIVLPSESEDGHHVYHQFTIRSSIRDKIKTALAAQEIGSAIYYPIPLHKQRVYLETNQGVALPNAELVSQQVLSLPMFPELTEDQVQSVCDTIATVK